MPSEDPTPKPERKFQNPENPELGLFDPFLGRSGFSRGSRFWPPLLYTVRTGRSATTGRSWSQNFTASRRRTRPDQAGEHGSSRHLGSPDFVIFRQFQADPYLSPTICGPSELISVVLFSDSSLFERYDKNKFGRLLDQVFRPPQQPLDQGKGTDVFLVYWAFH